MANTIEHHAKLMIGDLLLTIARLAAENEALREQLPKPTPPEDTAAATPEAITPPEA